MICHNQVVILLGLLAPVVQKLDIALSSGKITIQRIGIMKTNCIIHWVDIYPVDSTIHLLNNRGLPGCQPPRLQILRIDGGGMINDIIMHMAHDVICEKNAQKRCCWNCNI